MRMLALPSSRLWWRRPRLSWLTRLPRFSHWDWDFYSLASRQVAKPVLKFAKPCLTSSMPILSLLLLKVLRMLGLETFSKSKKCFICVLSTRPMLKIQCTKLQQWLESLWPLSEKTLAHICAWELCPTWYSMESLQSEKQYHWLSGCSKSALQIC